MILDPNQRACSECGAPYAPGYLGTYCPECSTIYALHLARRPVPQDAWQALTARTAQYRPRQASHN